MWEIDKIVRNVRWDSICTC